MVLTAFLCYNFEIIDFIQDYGGIPDKEWFKKKEACWVCGYLSYCESPAYLVEKIFLFFDCGSNNFCRGFGGGGFFAKCTGQSS